MTGDKSETGKGTDEKQAEATDNKSETGKGTDEKQAEVTGDKSETGKGTDEKQVEVTDNKSEADKAADDKTSAITDNKPVVHDSDVQLVTGIGLSGLSHKIAVNKKIKLTANVTPSNATNRNIIWTSSNTEYATVDQNGNVKLKKTGKNHTVTIYATAADGSGVKADYEIKIMPKAVKKIKLKAASTTVKAGKKVKVKATVTPSSKKQVNTTLKWSSNNKKYATVSQKGVVTTKKAGKNHKVKITARATDGSDAKKTITIKIK